MQPVRYTGQPGVGGLGNNLFDGKRRGAKEGEKIAKVTKEIWGGEEIYWVKSKDRL